MKSNADICADIQSAFLPLRCVAEVVDYNKKIQFRVFGPNDEILLTFPDLVIDILRNDSYLMTILDGAKNKLRAKGFVLNQS